jgi:hypothetical protein
MLLAWFLPSPPFGCCLEVPEPRVKIFDPLLEVGQPAGIEFESFDKIDKHLDHFRIIVWIVLFEEVIERYQFIQAPVGTQVMFRMQVIRIIRILDVVGRTCQPL